VLLILSCLPNAVPEAELASIAGLPVDRVRAATAELQLRHLALATPDGEGVHAAHPFVRQFVMSWPNHGDVQTKLHAWANRVLQARGGDRNWNAYPALNELWPNLRSVLQLAATDAPEEFLRLWRLADYFLWSSGRRRERERLGQLAVDLAREATRFDYLVHALYDSVAECRWHSSGTEAECKRLLDQAVLVSEKMPDPGPHPAMIEHYRSRMHRHFKNLDEAATAAQKAVLLARKYGDELVIGLCENALGNVFRSQREYDVALSHFAKAAECFEHAQETEMTAIVLRNQGRCHGGMGRHGEAIAALEESVEILRGLSLDIECAEAALDHAKELAALGETDEAIAEATAAKELFAGLGALHLLRDADDLLGRIDGRGRST
jgi:tetratricopeptide (TPR) repeat protein